MKHKRLLSMLLALVMLVGILPSMSLHAHAAVILGVNDSYNTKSQTPSQSAVFTTAYVRNKGADTNGRGTARQLEVMVQLGDVTSNAFFGAVVMKATDYENASLYNKSPVNINDTSMFAPNAAVQSAYYGIGLRTGTPSDANKDLKLEIVNTDSDKNNLTNGGAVTYKNMAISGVGTTAPYYFVEYVLVVFAQDTSGVAAKYYVDRFYLDSEGYVRTPSYMVQYEGNNPPGDSNPASVPGRQIQRAAWSDANLTGGAPGSTTLSGTRPTCTGYSFVGWTTTAKVPLQEGEAVPDDVYRAGASFPEQSPYSVTTLYALWQVVPIKFNKTGLTVDTDGLSVIEFPHQLQVGVVVPQTVQPFLQPGSGNPEPAGTKNWNLQVLVGGTDVTAKEVTGNGTGGVRWNNLLLGKYGNNWGLTTVTNTSGPNRDTYDGGTDKKDVMFVIEVTDLSNNTKDKIKIHFSGVEKRAQDAPDRDVNTGLEGAINMLNGDSESKLPADVETEKITELGVADAAALYADGFTDGQMIGFYSMGQKTVQNSASGETMNDKSGSLRDYYLKNGMIYEYRPMQVGSDTLTYDSDDAGWRELPFPKAYYTGDNLTKVESGMAYKTATTAYTTTKVGQSNVSGAGVLNVEVKQSETPWTPDYGWIEWNSDGLPVVHGLAEGDIYQVRFRANATSSASAAVNVTITAGGGGGTAATSAGGLAVNLAGGTTSETQAAVNTQVKYNDLLEEAAKLQPGGTLDLSVFDFEPVRENYTFAGWTTGEIDEATKTPKLYRAPTKVTVTWLDPQKDGEDKTLKSEAVVSGSALPEAPTPANYENQTFLTWLRAEDSAGNITFTAAYVPAGTVTYIWRDSAAEEGAGPLRTADLPAPPEKSTYPEVTPPEGKVLEWVISAPETVETEEGTRTTVYITAEYKTPGQTAVATPYQYQVPTQGVSSLAAVWEATTGGFFPIVFYDWDGVTLLGTKIVPKTSNAADQQRLIDEAMKEMAVSQMSVANAEAYQAAGYDPAQGTDAAYYDEDKPLSNKKGYTFGKWIDFDAVDENGNEVYTSYGIAVNVTNNTQMAADIPEPAGHVFSQADLSGFTVKAAYSSNATMEPLKDAGTNARHYMVTVTDYLQYGSGTNYGLTVKINRAQDGQGVPRVRELGLRVSLVINGDTLNPVFLLQELDNKDEVTTTVAVNGTVTSASFTVIDLCDNLSYGGTTNWASSASPRSVAYTVTPGGEDGFVILSGVGFFNDLCKSSTAMGLVSADWSGNSQAFRDSGLSVAAANYTTAGLTGATGASGRRNGVAKILAMYQSLPETRNLTKKEMQEAITNSTVWDSANSCWSNPDFVSDFVENQ